MKHSERFLRKRKFLTVAPLIVYPFLCLIFWALGGGQVKAVNRVEVAEEGLNTKLPEANLNEGENDILSLYDQAARDSAKLRELREIEARNFGVDTSAKNDIPTSAERLNTTYSYKAHSSQTEEKVSQRLSQLQKQLELASSPQQRHVDQVDQQISNQQNYKLAQMQQILQAAEPDQGQDTELLAINGMLDKIMKIQNPQLIQEELRVQSAKERGKVFTLDDTRPKASLTMGNNKQGWLADSVKRNKFFSTSSSVNRRVVHNAIKAIVYTGGQFVSGATIQLMLEEDLYLNGNLVPKGSSVFGVGDVTNERMKVRVTSIGVGQLVFRVDMSVFDLDAQEGISAPGAITRNEVKDGTANALQSMNVGMLDPSLGAQAASAGIETAKSLMTKKAKMVYANIPAGHHVLLIDNKQYE